MSTLRCAVCEADLAMNAELLRIYPSAVFTVEDPWECAGVHGNTVSYVGKEAATFLHNVRCPSLFAVSRACLAYLRLCPNEPVDLSKLPEYFFLPWEDGEIETLADCLGTMEMPKFRRQVDEAAEWWDRASIIQQILRPPRPWLETLRYSELGFVAGLFIQVLVHGDFYEGRDAHARWVYEQHRKHVQMEQRQISMAFGGFRSSGGTADIRRQGGAP